MPMIRPACYNIPEGKSDHEVLSDELLELLEGVFQAVTHAFGDDATLYRLDIGKVYESVQSGDLVVAGQFVDRSDGEVFDFEINQGTEQIRYKTTGDFLDQQSLAKFLGKEAADDDGDSSTPDKQEILAGHEIPEKLEVVDGLTLAGLVVDSGHIHWLKEKTS